MRQPKRLIRLAVLAMLGAVGLISRAAVAQAQTVHSRSPREDRDQQFLDHPLLPDDHLPQLRLQTLVRLSQEPRGFEVGVGRVEGGGSGGVHAG